MYKTEKMLILMKIGIFLMQIRFQKNFFKK